jgi:hypothetical protein
MPHGCTAVLLVLSQLMIETVHPNINLFLPLTTAPAIAAPAILLATAAIAWRPRGFRAAAAPSVYLSDSGSCGRGRGRGACRVLRTRAHRGVGSGGSGAVAVGWLRLRLRRANNPPRGCRRAFR